VSTPERSVTIIGATGQLGFGLAVRLAAAGVAVTIGSRDADRAVAAAQRAAGLAGAGAAAIDGLANPQAAGAHELVVLSVPFASHQETLVSMRESMREGQILIDATVPLAATVGGRATRMLGVWQGSAAQQAQELVPDGVSVVGALATLADVSIALDEDVLVLGDRRADKGRVAELIGRVPGLRCVDAGRLEMARVTESLTALLISMNIRYKTHAGIRITGLPDSLW